MVDWKQIIRFSVAGSIVNAVDLGLYYILFRVLPLSIAKAISFLCAAVVGYLLSKHWTFQSRHLSYAEIVRYAAVNVLALGLNVAVNQLVLNYFPGKALFAVITATVITGFFTYILFKQWVFKKI